MFRLYVGTRLGFRSVGRMGIYPLKCRSLGCMLTPVLDVGLWVVCGYRVCGCPFGCRSVGCMCIICWYPFGCRSVGRMWVQGWNVNEYVICWYPFGCRSLGCMWVPVGVQVVHGHSFG